MHSRKNASQNTRILTNVHRPLSHWHASIFTCYINKQTNYINVTLHISPTS